MPVHAPYNFVPLSKKVFFPDWADQVSHDVPFSDGISGTIKCTLTTESPVYVRNGGNWTRDDIANKDLSKEKKDAHSFFRVRDEFIIPGTSLKGMLRSVIEIVSFGKLSRVDNHKYSFRDLTKGHPYLKLMRGSKAGWLTLNDDTRIWSLTPCELARVDHNDLIKYDPNANDIKKEQKAKSKYELWSKSLEVMFDLGKKTPSGIRAINLGGSSATTTGTIVFTGQPSVNDGKKGKKHLEFIFYPKGTTQYPISSNLLREVEFIHSESEDWEFHKTRGVIPVFFHGSPSSPTSIGLAMMYRLPYSNSIYDAIKHIDAETGKDHFHPDLDLAETIFGIEGDPDGLKGRVFISPAIAVKGTAVPGNLFHTILGGPTPTYYPIYLEQPHLPASYTTLLDSASTIRGWKRYPARTFDANKVTKPTDDQIKVSTKFIPLNKNAKFEFTIRIHNLRPAELGALLWALEWGGNKELCHGLGMGKSYGFGQVKIQIESDGSKLNNPTSEQVNLDDCKNEFEKLMVEQVADDWNKTEQLTQLLGMANAANAKDKTLRHMTIEPNQFVEMKNAKLCLDPYITYSYKSDSERFNNLTSRPVKEKPTATAKKNTTKVVALDPLTTSLQYLEKVTDWGGFKQHVLSNEILNANKELPNVSKPVYQLALQLKTKWKSSWEAERDQLIAEWLQPSGLVWPPVEQTAATTINEAGAELERLNAITKWADYLAAPANLDILSKNGLKKLKEKLEGWGCKANDAKEDKKTMWAEVNRRLKS